MENYLHNKIPNIVYIDSDMICIKDPTNTILQTIKELRNKDLLLAAKTSPLSKIQMMIDLKDLKLIQITLMRV